MNNIPSECRCTLSPYNEPLMEDRGSYFSKEEYVPFTLDFVSMVFYFETVFKKLILKTFYFLILQENSFSCLNDYHVCSHHISHTISNHKPITSCKTQEISNKIKTNHTKPLFSHDSIS